jgi:hypothetical protein
LPKKILKYGTGQHWLSIYGLFVIRPNLYGLHGYLLICCEVGVFGRFLALEIVHGAGERFSVYVVWFRNLSTSVLEMGVLFLYGLIMASIRPLSGVR